MYITEYILAVKSNVGEMDGDDAVSAFGLEFVDKLTQRISRWAADPRSELEAVIQDVDRRRFEDLRKRLLAREGTSVSTATFVDLSATMTDAGKELRITVSGKDALKDLDRSSTLRKECTTVIEKKAPLASPLPSELGVRITLKSETPASDRDIRRVLEAFPRGHVVVSHVRYKNRYSFVNDKTAVRHDLTVVRSADSLAAALRAPDTYEIELELTRGDPDQAPRRIASVLLSEILWTLGPVRALGARVETAALDAYLALTSAKVSASDARRDPKAWFIGPNPVTLELKHLATLAPISIVSNAYTVTDKADGERRLLFADGQGSLYTINNRLEVAGIAGTSKHANSILDGEWIAGAFASASASASASAFAAFDAYFLDGQPCHRLPLIAAGDARSRFRAMSEFVEGLLLRSQDRVFVKRFETGDALAAAKRLWSNRSELPYGIDGLVFTPQTLAVGASSSMHVVDVADLRRSTWDRTLKWKPATHLSIDFKVKAKRDPVSGDRVMTVDDADGATYAVMELEVAGDRSSRLVPHSCTNFWLRPRAKAPPPTARCDRKFAPAGFAESVGEYLADPDRPVCDNGDPLVEGGVAEFVYVGKRSGSRRRQVWRPLRTRPDKTSGNGTENAMAVWRAIQQPVTADVITGDAPPPFVPNPTTYYRRADKRNVLETFSVAKFHGEVKRALLVDPFRSMGVRRVFDVACGPGGDVQKYLAAGVTELLGVDLFVDNIAHPEFGAYSRLPASPNTPMYVFLPMDASVKIDVDGRGPANAVTGDDDDRRAAGLLWGSVEPDTTTEQKFAGFARRPFDAVSCQFALHYFFASDATLDAFVANVDAHLRVGGVFVATCFDGRRVLDLLGGDAEKTRRGSDGRVLWKIRTTRPHTVEGPVIPLGRGIHVYLESIGSENEEFLVDLSALTSRFAAKGIRPASARTMSRHFPALPSWSSGFEALYGTDSAKTRLSQDERTFSFLNMWCVYEKTTDHA